MEIIYNKFNRFSIREIFNIEKEKWNDFVRSNSTGHVFHLYDLSIMGIYQECENISFAIYDNCNKEIVLLMPLYLKKEKISEKHGYSLKLVSQRGLVIKDNLPPKVKNYLTNFFIDYFDELFLRYRIENEFVIEMPALAKFNQIKGKQVINPLVYLGFEPSIRYSWVINLKKPIKRIFEDCEATTRQALRKLLKSQDYYFCEPTDETKFKDCQDFIKLAKETYARSLGEPKNSKYYEYLFNNIPSSLCRFYFLKDSKTKSIIASAIILIYEDTAFYFSNVSKTEKPVGINKFLVYRIMLELKKMGITLFEVGGAYPYSRIGSKRKGISDFKKSFGAELHTIHKGMFVRNKFIYISKKTENTDYEK